MVHTYKLYLREGASVPGRVGELDGGVVGGAAERSSISALPLHTTAPSPCTD